MYPEVINTPGIWLRWLVTDLEGSGSGLQSDQICRLFVLTTAMVLIPVSLLVRDVGTFKWQSLRRLLGHRGTASRKDYFLRDWIVYRSSSLTPECLTVWIPDLPWDLSFPQESLPV